MYEANGPAMLLMSIAAQCDAVLINIDELQVVNVRSRWFDNRGVKMELRFSVGLAWLGAGPLRRHQV